MSVMRIFMCHELVGKVLKMFKYFMQFFSPKYFARMSQKRDFLAKKKPQWHTILEKSKSQHDKG